MTQTLFGTGKNKPQNVNRSRGIVTGVKICSAGEVKGRDFSLDDDFITELIKQGNASNGGLKSRFGHSTLFRPGIGTLLGRFKNFRKSTTVRDTGDRVSCCLADLHLSESAKSSPRGDLYEYILTLAENDADFFGISIAFELGNFYIRTESGEKDFYYDEDDGETVYVECEKLIACDCEDDPAANDGLFCSTGKRKLTLAEVGKLRSKREKAKRPAASREKKQLFKSKDEKPDCQPASSGRKQLFRPKEAI